MNFTHSSTTLRKRQRNSSWATDHRVEKKKFLIFYYLEMGNKNWWILRSDGGRNDPRSIKVLGTRARDLWLRSHNRSFSYLEHRLLLREWRERLLVWCPKRQSQLATAVYGWAGLNDVSIPTKGRKEGALRATPLSLLVMNFLNCANGVEILLRHQFTIWIRPKSHQLDNGQRCDTF